MLKPFLQHHYWSRHGNIPALVILMQAYLQKAPQDIVEKQFVQPILGIFQMLLGLSRHYGDATTLLASILSFLPMQVCDLLPPCMCDFLLFSGLCAGLVRLELACSCTTHNL